MTTRTSTWLRVGAAGAALLLVGGVGAAFAFGGTGAPAGDYATAQATTGSIAQTWSTTGAATSASGAGLPDATQVAGCRADLADALATAGAPSSSTKGSGAAVTARPTGSSSGSAPSASVGARTAASGATASGAGSSAGSSSAASSAARSASTGAASGSSSGSSGGGTQRSGPARVASDQTALLQAQQNLATARSTLDAATLRSPIAGRVAASTLIPGQASGSRTITVIGDGAATVTVNVPLSVRPLLAGGQAATVAVPGSAATLTGTVTRVSLLANSGSTAANPTYATVITVPDAQNLLFSGGVAGVTVTLGSVEGVTALPGSAVTPTGTGAGTVQVPGSDPSGSPRTVAVTTGATGGGFVQILSGVDPGETVVLADRNAAVPENSNQRFAAGTRTVGTVQPTSAATAVALPGATPGG